MIFGSKPSAPSVAILVPAQDMVHAMFTLDLVALVVVTMRQIPEASVRLFIHRGTLLPEQRKGLVVRAKEIPGLTHVLWLDSDMRFPADALVRMLGHQVPVVAANYATRRPPIIPTASSGGPNDLLLYSDEAATDLEEVGRAGMGCMLVEASVFDKLPKPWFALGYNKAKDVFAGEDVFFCHLLREHGFQVLVDPVLSREIKHCGGFEFTLAHAEVTRQRSMEAVGQQGMTA